MSDTPPDRNTPDTPAVEASMAEGGQIPLDNLPRLSSRQVDLDHRVRRLGDRTLLAERLLPGISIAGEAVEILGRAAGLNRPGVIAHLAWPRLDTRVGVGVETPLAHAIVDELLGFERLEAEGNRQVTPVEFGILTFVVARALDRLDAQAGPFGAWDLTIDRVSPDPFDPRQLGPILTCRWPARIGSARGSIRLWIPESLLNHLAPSDSPLDEPRPSFATLASTWIAEAGTITMPRGVSRLKPGGVFPIDGATLSGTLANPIGPVALICQGRDACHRIEVEFVPQTAAARVSVQSRPHREPTPREPIPVNPSPTPSVSSPDIPVTLVVELGRVSLTLSRLADLKVGDVIELGRHSREPVELTSNGKLVARGELVQIDTELGVRITNLLL